MGAFANATCPPGGLSHALVWLTPSTAWTSMSCLPAGFPNVPGHLGATQMCSYNPTTAFYQTALSPLRSSLTSCWQVSRDAGPVAPQLLALAFCVNRGKPSRLSMWRKWGEVGETQGRESCLLGYPAFQVGLLPALFSLHCKMMLPGQLRGEWVRTGDSCVGPKQCENLRSPLQYWLHL